MSEYTINGNTLSEIASAIRTKTGKSSTMRPVDMPSEIISIPSGEISTTEQLIDAEHGIYRCSWYADIVTDTKSKMTDYLITNFNPTCQATVDTLNAARGISGNTLYNDSLPPAEIFGIVDIWTNPSPTVTFAAQKVSIPNLDRFASILVNIRFAGSQGSYRNIWCLGEYDTLASAVTEASSNTSYGSYRAFKMVSDGVVFEEPKGIGKQGDTPEEAIPQKIYAIPKYASITDWGIFSPVVSSGKNVQGMIATFDYKKTT